VAVPELPASCLKPPHLFKFPRRSPCVEDIKFGKMQTLNYIKKTEVKETKTIYIPDENFICIESFRDGNRLITAFIDDAGYASEKLKIEVCPSGNFLNFSRLSGSPTQNAISLLERDSRNRQTTRDRFLHFYEMQIQHKLMLD